MMEIQQFFKTVDLKKSEALEEGQARSLNAKNILETSGLMAVGIQIIIWNVSV
jgi:hypothetical protein